MLIETDVLLSLISPEDRNHSRTVKLIEDFASQLKLSPYSLVELDLLVRSGKIVVKSVTAFYVALNELLKYKMIQVYAPKPEYHGEAYRLRKAYSLTYFDSLHASAAIVEDEELVSYDRRYLELMELKYLHPEKLTKGY
ncbi:MAG: PIN domain-containing protein [Thermofilaceae archaeon]|nr:PIN domain-containing protein [Thermofilaceae archaeon]